MVGPAVFSSTDWCPERNNMQPPPAPRRPLSKCTKGGVGGSPRRGARGVGVRQICDPRADLGGDGRRPRREPSRGGEHNPIGVQAVYQVDPR